MPAIVKVGSETPSIRWYAEANSSGFWAEPVCGITLKG